VYTAGQGGSVAVERTVYLEQEKNMRKLVKWGSAGVLISTAAVVLAAGYASRQPFSFIGRCSGILYVVGVECNPLYRLGRALGGIGVFAPQSTEDGSDGDVRVPEEPQPVGEGITNDYRSTVPMSETIELTPAPVLPSCASDLVEPGERDCWWMPGCIAEEEYLLGDFPDAPESDTKDRCGSSCEKATACPGCCTSRPDQRGSQEEQRGGAKNEADKNSAKSIRNRSSLPLPFLPEVLPARSALDTLEFRPSDAKKGEFDHIPF
jgi:hypothetical protein